MNKEPKSYIMSVDGERLKDIYEGDTIRIVRETSKDMFINTQDWSMEHFFKGHIDELRKVIQELSTYEKALMLSIASYVGYEDCCLKYSNGEDITTNDIVVLSGFSRAKAFETIESLMVKDILYRGKNSKNRQYFVNPWLFCKGNRINKVLKTMFQNYRIRVLGNKRWKDVRGD